MLIIVTNTFYEDLFCLRTAGFLDTFGECYTFFHGNSVDILISDGHMKC